MCGFLCIMEALAISGYVTFADQDGKTQAICRAASAANLTICSGTDYAKLSLLTGLRELRLDFSSLDYDDYDGDGVYEAFAFVAD